MVLASKFAGTDVATKLAALRKSLSEKHCDAITVSGMRKALFIGSA